jgi:hypothetical protein
MRDAMIMTDTRAAMDGMVTMRDIRVIMHRITGIITGVITQVITHIIIPNSNHAGHALRKKSTITTTIIAGGTFGNEKSRVREQFAPRGKMYILWLGFPDGYRHVPQDA